MARNSLVERTLLEAPFHSLHREMNRLFDDIFHGRLHSPQHADTAKHAPILPNIDISESGGEIRVSAELPGVSESDIEVFLDGEVLVIRGEKKVEKTKEEQSYHFVERAYGAFQRAVQLPSPVAADKVRADFANGVLTVTLPKQDEPEEKRKIVVQRGREQSPGQTAGEPAGPASKPSPQAASQAADPSQKRA